MTETIVFEPLTSAHVPALEALVADPLVLRFTRVPVPVPPGFADSWISRYRRGARDGTCKGFAIVDPAGAFLGLALAPVIDRETRTAELGYVIAEAARGRGIATAALARLTDWAFAELEAERLELVISVENEASKTVARRCGYRHEGVLRSVHIKAGVREDVEIWSRLPGDG
jgi:RimJ/RimL family protein N-acetyltransferase